MAAPLKRLTKYTDRELEERKIGTFIDPDGMYDDKTRMKTKKETYGEEGVLKSYTSLYRSFSVLLSIEYLGGIEDNDRRLPAKCAQQMIDAYLLRRSRGKKAEIPAQVHLYELKKEDPNSITLYDPDEVDGKPACSENEKLRWIFENMKIEGVQPSDAPSIGTFTLLMELRENNQMRTKFYETSWLKLLQKEDAEKLGKLEDTGKDTIALIERLQEALPKESE